MMVIEACFPEDWHRLIIRRKWFILAVAFGSALTAYVASGFVSPVWETVGLLQVARVPTVELSMESAGGSVPESFIESPLFVMERLKNPAVTREIFRKMNAQTNPDAHFLSSWIKLKLIPGSDLIEIRAKGYSSADSKKYIDAIVYYVAAIHDALKKEQREYIRVQLNVQQGRLRELQHQAGGENMYNILRSRQNDIAIALILIRRQTEQQELTTTLSSVRRLEFLLQSFDQAKTRLFGAAVIANQPVFPQRMLIAILVAFAGFIASVAWTLWKGLRGAV